MVKRSSCEHCGGGGGGGGEDWELPMTACISLSPSAIPVLLICRLLEEGVFVKKSCSVESGASNVFLDTALINTIDQKIASRRNERTRWFFRFFRCNCNCERMSVVIVDVVDDDDV